MGPFGRKLKVAFMPSVLGGERPRVIMQHRAGANSFSPDGLKQKKEGNVGPPNKQRTCAAIPEGACVSDLHAVWEVPHPPYVWNISALQGLNLTPALSSLRPLPAEPAASLLLLSAYVPKKSLVQEGAQGG